MQSAARWLVMISGILAAAAPAQPAEEVEGIYADDVFEVGSALVLAPDGRFLWTFSMGALDTAAQGRWTRAPDGTILLDSDPPVVAPRFELVGRSRDDRPGVAVRFVCETRDAYHFLDVLVEYADGERVHDRFTGLEYRTPADPPRRVAAVQLGSRAFDLLSERFPVGDDANVLTFRFVANDLGFTDFRNQRVVVERDWLSFAWRGMDLRYHREASAMGETLPLLPRPSPPETLDPMPPAPVEIRMGEPVEELQMRVGAALTYNPDDRTIRALGPVDLRLGIGAAAIDLGRIEAIGPMPLVVGEDNVGVAVGSVSFPYQDGPLTLEQAMARARSLRAQLEQAGFGPASTYEGDPMPSFLVLPYSGVTTPRAADWDSAARMLGDEAQAIVGMQLFALETRDHLATVTLYNARRQALEACAHADWPDGGRDWRLYVNIGPNLLRPAEESSAQP